MDAANDLKCYTPFPERKINLLKILNKGIEMRLHVATSPINVQLLEEVSKMELWLIPSYA